jgi:hypothetical protein
LYELQALKQKLHQTYHKRDALNIYTIIKPETNMKKLILLLAFISTFFITNCSNDDDVIKKNDEQVTDGGNVTPDPKPTTPTLVSENKRKSAIVTFLGGSKTGKLTGKSAGKSAATKRLVKSIQYISTSPFDTKFKTRISYNDYLALPTDNLYDKEEDLLNANTQKYEERTYTYNELGNLEKITINNIAYPGYNSMEAYKPIIYEYNSDGSKKQISRYQSIGMVMNFEYNSLGQIVKAFNIYGELMYDFFYDEYGNIAMKILYLMGKPHMKYTYIFYPDNTYEKTWIDIEDNERVASRVKYKFNKNVKGVYFDEALYKAISDNQEGLQYLHITENTAGYRPKYFYDSEGYLIKYDKVGKNDANDITIFIYE